MRNYCVKCGGKVIVKGERRGSYSKSPEYFDEDTGKEIWHREYECENTEWWKNWGHTYYYADFTKDN